MPARVVSGNGSIQKSADFCGSLKSKHPWVNSSKIMPLPSEGRGHRFESCRVHQPSITDQLSSVRAVSVT
jgi:hypothetical protein